MEINVFKKWDENYLAVALTLVVIGLLFLLKFQEDKITESSSNKSVSNSTTLITYVE